MILFLAHDNSSINIFIAKTFCFLLLSKPTAGDVNKTCCKQCNVKGIVYSPYMEVKVILSHMSKKAGEPEPVVKKIAFLKS